MSAVTASITNSAVLPMKKRLRPERDTTPIATMALRSRLAVRGMTSFGPALHEVAVAALHVEAVDGALQLAARLAFEFVASRGHVEHRSVGHGRHDRHAGNERVQRMQFAMQRMHQLRAGAQDLPVEVARFGKRM